MAMLRTYPSGSIKINIIINQLFGITDILIIQCKVTYENPQEGHVLNCDNLIYE
jgi:hypothetical protein